MAKLLKLRRGTTTQHASFTGAEGEVTVDTSKDTAVVHDGSQAGGRPLAREDMNNVSGANIKSRLNAQITNGEVNNSAAIAGTKISPNFGSQNVVTTGNITGAVIYGDGSNLTGVQPFPSGTKMLFQQTSAPTGWTKITSGVNNKSLRVVSGTVGSGGNVAFTTAFATRGITANAGNTTQGGNVNVSVANATQGGNVSIGDTTAGGNVSIANASTGGTVNSHTLSSNEMPSHYHNIPAYNPDNRGATGRLGHARTTWAQPSVPTNNTGGSGGHSHGFTGGSHSHTGTLSGTAHNHNASFSGSAHSHTANASFSGSAHNHSISVGNLDMQVEYLDVIIASKD